MTKKAGRSGEKGERARRAMPRAAMTAVVGAIGAALAKPSVGARLRETYESARAWLKNKTAGPIERPAPSTGPASGGL